MEMSFKGKDDDAPTYRRPVQHLQKFHKSYLHGIPKRGTTTLVKTTYD